MTQPTTAAGTTLLEDLCDCIGDEDAHDRRCRCVRLAPTVAAIEAEARADLLDRLAAVPTPPRTLAQPDPFSQWLVNAYVDGWEAAVLALIEEARK